MSLNVRREQIAEILVSQSDSFAGIVTAAAMIEELGIVAAKRFLDKNDDGGPLWQGYREFVEQRLA